MQNCVICIASATVDSGRVHKDLLETKAVWRGGWTRLRCAQCSSGPSPGLLSEWLESKARRSFAWQQQVHGQHLEQPPKNMNHCDPFKLEAIAR